MTDTTAAAEPERVDITESAAVEPSVFIRVAESGADLSLEGDGYSWLFNGAELKGATVTESFDATVKVGEQVAEKDREQIAEAAGEQTVYPFTFAHHGELPATATVSIRVAEEYSGKEVYVYYLNDEGAAVQAATATVAADGTLSFDTDHCSLWFISAEPIADAIVEQSGTAPVVATWVWIVIAVGGVLVLAGAAVVVLLILKKRKA